jgi:hypothetical protein
VLLWTANAGVVMLPAAIAASAATIVKVFVAVKSRIFYLLLHIGFSYPIGYPQA